MGAKQSKRSVDISGKEAESGGEVAAAGAGGEGRMEPLADGEAPKPQLNGDAHIQPPQEISDKEKQLDSGTPENEKDATTEKEGKEEQNTEKEAIPATNGDSEPKENGDTAPEDGKKPKKEKVKKKWSLRSISFSRKDKPKQEKKSKEEEPKTNGEPEKVPEETAEASAENVENKVAEVVKGETEVKEEKTPETPVTEPLTNGTSSPDEPAAEPEPDHLPINGLSLEEPKKETEIAPIEESKQEETTVAATETVPVPEIPVKTEVCDAKMPLIEPTPPPLPANPPPSSVASFAATTMAPELIDASLANTTENVILAPPTIPAEKPVENVTEPQVVTYSNLAVSQISPSLKEAASEDVPVASPTTEAKNTDCDTLKDEPIKDNIKMDIEEEIIDSQNANSVSDDITATSSATPAAIESDPVDAQDQIAENVVTEEPPIELSASQNGHTPEPASDVADTIDDLPPPPPLDDDILQKDAEETEHEVLAPSTEEIANANHNLANDAAVTNGVADNTEHIKLKDPKRDALGNVVDVIECNGNGIPEEDDGAPPAALQQPAALAADPQDPLPIADKIADLIPEIPTLPELNTETEASSAVAVAD